MSVRCEMCIIQILLVQFMMEGCPSQASEVRPRFRSFKYNINYKSMDKKQEWQSQSKPRESIINISKLGSALKNKPTPNTQNQTISLSHKQDDNIYVRTFTTFFSRDNIKDCTGEDKENIKFKVLIPEYDHNFDDVSTSDFTFLDTMLKPVKFIDNQLFLAQKQLKRQRNDLQMLRAEMNALKNGINERLEDILSTVNHKLGELKECFHSNEVLENERKLRSRKQMRILERGHELNARMLQNLKQRNLDIQQRIFNCHPLELQFQQGAVVLEINQNEYL